MKRSQAQPLKDVLRAYVKAKGWNRNMVEGNIKNNWKQIMGPTIAAKTSNIYLKENTVFIYLNSSVLRNELMMMQDQIVERLNEAIGEELVQQVVLR